MQVNSCGNTLKLSRPAFVLAGLLLLLSSFVYAAAPDDALWTKGNTFYAQKQYDSAVNCYRQLLQKYPGNALLQYNTGNAFYRLNQVGAAILHYEKAAFLEPGNKEIKDNLLLAKGRVQNPVPEVAPIFFVSWWRHLLSLFSTNTWAILSLLVFMVILVLIYLARIRKEQFAHSGRWLSLGIVSLLICGCMTYFTHDAAVNSGKAVVLQAGTSLIDAPKASGKALGNLPEGTVVEVYQEEGNFINVKLPNGSEGWIAAAAAEKV